MNFSNMEGCRNEISQACQITHSQLGRAVNIEPNPDKATIEFNNLKPQEKADVMQLKKMIKPIVMEVRNHEVTVPAAVTKVYR